MFQSGEWRLPPPGRVVAAAVLVLMCGVCPAWAQDGATTPLIWQAYPGYIVVTAAVVVGQLFLIAMLLLQRRDLRRAEQSVRTREADLRGSYEQVRELAGRLIHAQEAARAGVARDLHDEICQQLAAVSIGVVALKRSHGNVQDPAVQDAFDDLEYQTQVTFDGIRRLSHELHPTSLRLVGLAPALRTHCVDMGERHHVAVTFNAAGDCRGLPDDVAICLYRIAQEAVRNAIFHGAARQISVSLTRSDRHADLVVADDGHGFDVQATRQSGRGLGLVSITERARLAGGQVDFRSTARGGTTVHVHCPVEALAVERAKTQPESRPSTAVRS
jgi:signal transduction histidine kinase